MVRNIVYSKQFTKSLKRLLKSGIFQREKLESVLDVLMAGKNLSRSLKDHALKGDWQGYRECHIEYDLLLIYEIHLEELRLIEIGTHSELFG